jgi:hypothetical protein
MNYPWGYPAGPEAFWSAFPFQFDNLELIHLRHAFLNNIIIGGNPFGVGAALEAPEAFADSVEDHSGLMLELEAPKPSVALGEPVVVELKLKLTDLRGKRVHTQLHPNKGAVQIGIRKPGGQVVVYEPMMEACVAAETVAMDMDNPAIYDSAYIGYGKDGFYFDQVGTYHIRAAYYALDGSEIMSNIMPLRVRAPHTLEDEEIADLFLGDDQGALFYLLGSDSQFLSRGNEALDQVLDKHRNHPLSVYARLIKGINESREFKTFTTEKDKVNVRKPRLIESKELLTDVVDVSEKGKGIDNITLSQTMRKLAEVQKAAGDEKGANATISHMVEVFRQKDLKPHVQRRIEQMAEAELEGLITEEE